MIWEFLDKLESVTLIAGLLTGAAYWVRVKLRRRKIQVSGSFGELAILNFSAHPINSSEQDWAAAAAQTHLPLELELDTPEQLANGLIAGIGQLSKELQARLMAGDPNLVIAFPAPRGSAGLLDAILHGIVGEWTKTTWSVRTDAGFVWVKPVDRQLLRLRARRELRGTIKV